MRTWPSACALSALGLAAALAAAQPGGPAPVTQDGACAFSGWSGDPDPAGLNVRAAPSSDAAIVGRLPPPEGVAEYEMPFAAEFDVLESRDGWFRIANAYRWSDEREQPSRLPSGWISGRYLDFALQTDKAFAEPDPSSDVVATSWMDRREERHEIAFRQPTACRGEWVRLTVTGHDGRAREAWVRGVCGNQETTCDGVRGDLIDYDDLPRH